jgi:dCMP deaminase
MSIDFSEKWHRRFLALSEMIATWSKDPSRGVGAVIVSPAKQVISTGFNGLPRAIEDLPERLERPAKYDLIVHAEMNAIIQCARNGVSPNGCAIYSSFFPCIHCAIAIVQAGITTVVAYEPITGDEHWLASIEKSRAVFREAKVEFLELRRD